MTLPLHVTLPLEEVRRRLADTKPLAMAHEWRTDRNTRERYCNRCGVPRDRSATTWCVVRRSSR